MLCGRCFKNGIETELLLVPEDPREEPFAVRCPQCDFSTFLSKARREDVLISA